MGLRNLNELINRFWSGETSLEEEQHLKKYPESENAYFKYLNRNKSLELSTDFERKILSKIEGDKEHLWNGKFYYYLAAASIVLTIGFFFARENHIAKQREARLAFEQTREALLLVSSKLNKGAEYSNEFQKINNIISIKN